MRLDWALYYRGLGPMPQPFYWGRRLWGGGWSSGYTPPATDNRGGMHLNIWRVVCPLLGDDEGDTPVSGGQYGWCELRWPLLSRHVKEFKKVLLISVAWVQNVGPRLGFSAFEFGGGVEVTFRLYFYPGNAENTHTNVKIYENDRLVRTAPEPTCLTSRPNYIGGQSYDFTISAKAQVCFIWCWDVASGYLYPFHSWQAFGISL